MPVEAKDVKIKLSVKTKAGDPQPKPTDPADGSLGGFVSATELDGATKLNNLFDDISGKENKDKTIDYRCVFVHNTHASLPMKLITARVIKDSSDTTKVWVGADPTAASEAGAANKQALEIATETDEPAGVTWVEAQPTGTASPDTVDLGEIAAGQVKAIWFKREPQGGPAVDNDEITLEVEWDTGA